LCAINFNLDELGAEKQRPEILLWLPYYFEVFIVLRKQHRWL